MHLALDDLEVRIVGAGPFDWVHPRNVDGIDAHQLKQFNRDRWFAKECAEADFTPGDRVVVTYLLACIRRSGDRNERVAAYAKETDIDPDMKLDAAVYMIGAWGSSFAATMFGRETCLIIEENAVRSVDLLLTKYDEAEPFIRDIFRDFVLDLVRDGSESGLITGYIAKNLREDQHRSIKHLFDNGYVTIDNSDCRFIADGRRRI